MQQLFCITLRSIGVCAVLTRKLVHKLIDWLIDWLIDIIKLRLLILSWDERREIKIDDRRESYEKNLCELRSFKEGRPIKQLIDLCRHMLLNFLFRPSRHNIKHQIFSLNQTHRKHSSNGLSPPSSSSSPSSTPSSSSSFILTLNILCSIKSTENMITFITHFRRHRWKTTTNRPTVTS